MRLVIVLALLSVPAYPGTITIFTDSPSNDLPSSGFPLLGTLSPGTYDVKGLLLLGSNNGDTDEDTFSVEAAAGSEIVSEEINFSYNDGSDISITEPIDGTTDITKDLDEVLTATPPITSVFDVDISGTPIAVCTGPGNTPPCSFTPAASYDITFTVAANVPEPASLSLFGVGTALLFMMGKLLFMMGKKVRRS